MRAVVTANLASNLGSRKNLLQALSKAGWELLLAGRADHGTEGLKDLGYEFQELPMENKGTNLFADLGTLIAFFRLYRKFRPDAVLHFNSKPDIYGSMAASLLGIPAISNVTGLGMVYVGSGGPVRLVVNALYRLAFLGKRNKVFFQNEDDRDLFVGMKILRREKALLLPGSGVDVDRFRPDSDPEPPRGRAVEAGSFTFLFASRLVLSKGVREFIAAAAELRKEMPRVRFVMMGEHLDFKSFIPRVELEAALAQGIVEYRGEERDTLSALRDCDCVVLPSYYREGVPRILLEGAAMGKPLIAADSIGTREPVIDGKNGFLCIPGSAADLAAKMRRMAQMTAEERFRMGQASRQTAEERFADRIVTRRYLEALPGGITS